VDQPAAKAVPVPSAPRPVPPYAPPAAAAAAAPPPSQFEKAAAGLIETGVQFLESLTAVAQNAPTEPFSNLVSLDPRTKRPVLSIPLPDSVDQNRLVQALSSVLSAFARSA
jgi:hypothetical protein